MLICGNMGCENFCKIVFLFILLDFNPIVNAEVEVLTEDNWQDMLEGEWLVEFYAPWCPACKNLAPTWEQLGQRSTDLVIHFAKIDVTENPILSGRFFVTALPTIYHVNAGVFRQYRGHRSTAELISFIRGEAWRDIEPLPWYWSPTSIHMAAVGMFFEFSITIRNAHNTMTTEYGIPVWGSYLIFALITILIGLIIGLVIVCLCDAVHMRRYRRVSRQAQRTTISASGSATEAEDDDDDGLGEAGKDDINFTDELDLHDDDEAPEGTTDDLPPAANDSPGGATSNSPPGDSTVRRRDVTTSDTAVE